MISTELACFLEQVTPEIRKKFTHPGESFKSTYETLSTLDIGEHQEELTRLLKVFERLSNLPNEGFIEFVGVFEKHVMHTFIIEPDQFMLE